MTVNRGMQSYTFQDATRFSVAALQIRGIRLLLIAVITIQYIYLFSFNYAPEMVRTGFAASLLAIHLLLAAAALTQVSPRPWQMAILTAAGMTICCWLVAHGTLSTSKPFDPQGAFRDLSLYAMALWLLTFPQALPHRYLMVVTIAATLVGGAIALTGPPVYVSGTPRLASITGGVAQMHLSAKLILLQLIVLDQYRRARMLPELVAWPVMLFAVAILIGYGGRNQMTFLAAYVATLTYYSFRRIPAVRWSPPILIALAIIGAAVALSFGTNVQSWGSGRIGVWQHRLELIADRDLLVFLFGGGVGSDQIWNPQWWWMPHVDAHNDFLHIAMETGALGLSATLLFLIGLWLRLPGSSKAVLVGMLFESFLSNGQFQSPLVALNFFLAAAVAAHCWSIGQATRTAARGSSSRRFGAPRFVRSRGEREPTGVHGFAK
jgi:hypothetical protein